MYWQKGDGESETSTPQLILLVASYSSPLVAPETIFGTGTPLPHSLCIDASPLNPLASRECRSRLWRNSPASQKDCRRKAKRDLQGRELLSELCHGYLIDKMPPFDVDRNVI